MAIWQQEINLVRLNERSENTMGSHLGIEFVEIGEEFLIAKMPVFHGTKQPIGIMHGGASCVLAETVGSTAANFCVQPAFYCVGLDINTNHIRSIRKGYVFGKATPYHIGKMTQVWGIAITDEQGQLISVNRLTMAVLSKK